MKIIPLTKGYSVKVDDEDYNHLRMHKWYYLNGYAVRTMYCKSTKRTSHVFMHRLLVNFSDPNNDVDHINNDGLDNQRSNLREATRQQNAANRPLFSNNKSGFRGVSWDKCRSKWQAQITVKGKVYRLGRGTDPEKLAAIYNARAKEVFGEFASLNVVSA